MAITATERKELRAVVKQQFKVLRAEIKQREAELRAEANQALMTEAGQEDKQWESISFLANEAVQEANRKVNDVLKESGIPPAKGGSEYNLVFLDSRFSGYFRAKTDQGAAKATIDLNVKERVRTAELAIERQEADLLRTLAVGALESDEARAFVSAIPTVAELVPSARLQELVSGAGAE